MENMNEFSENFSKNIFAKIEKQHIDDIFKIIVEERIGLNNVEIMSTFYNLSSANIVTHQHLKFRDPNIAFTTYFYLTITKSGELILKTQRDKGLLGHITKKPLLAKIMDYLLQQK